MGFLRISLLTLVSAFFVACGKDESNGDDDDDGDTTNTTGTPTTNTTGTPTTNTATSGNPTNTATSNGGSSSTTASQGGSGGAGGSGGTTSVGGSAGGGGDMGGSAGAGEGGDGGTTDGGVVVVEDDCSYEACGGDLANTDWEYSRICVEKDALLAPFQGFCETIDVVSAGGEVAGTIGFADDTFIQDVTFSVTGEFAVPQDCIVLSCAVVGLGLASAGLTDTSCVESDTGCLCSGTLNGESALDGDYSIDGDTLSLDGEEASYCASGDSFKYLGEIEGVEFVYEAVPQ